MTIKKPLSLAELNVMNANMHTQSKEQLLANMEIMFAAMEPEVVAVFRNLFAQAKAMPPKPRLTEITPASLRSLSGEDLDGALYDYVATKLLGASDPRATLMALPRGLQVFYLSYIVEVEVMNGGLDQFFYNNGVDLADLVAPALRDLGAHAAASHFEHACEIALGLPPLPEPEDAPHDYVASQAEQELAQLDQLFCPLARQFQALRGQFVSRSESLCLHAPGQGD